jgi:bacterial/archaeal transporter family protein
MQTWLICVIVALVFWGITGVTQKLSTNSISGERSFLWFCWAMIVLTLAVAAFAHVPAHLGALALLSSIAGGALNGLGAWTSFRALGSGGKASVVISLISLYPMLTVVLAVIFLRERLTAHQIVGTVLAVAAAILLSLESPAESPAQNP